MYRKAIWMTVVLSMGFVGLNPSHAQDESGNYFLNGSFEDGVPDPWGVYGGATAEVVSELVGAAINEDPIEGDLCLHVKVPAAGANWWEVGLVPSGAVFEQGKKYTVSAFLKCKEGTFQVDFKPQKAADPWTGYSQETFTITEEWAEYSVTTPVFAENVTPAGVTFHIGFAAGEFWIDGVRFYEGDYVEPDLGLAELASRPNPENGATDVPREVVLSWTPGEYAAAVNGHRVYLSESFNDVNEGIGGITVSDASYTPPHRLEFETTYYWRIDEVSAPPDSTAYKGGVWNFTTEPVGYPIDGANIAATASSMSEAIFGPEKTIDGSGLDENSLLHSIEPTDMWLSANEPQGAWIQYELDKMYKLYEMWVWNSNQIFERLFGFGMKDVTVAYSTNGVDWTALADVPEFAKAPGAAGYAHDTIVDFGGVVAKYVRLTASSNWGGVLPQFGLSEVRLFYIPVSAREPSPDAGAIDVDVDTTLTWRAGREAATHNLYLSDDQQAVVDGAAPVTTVTDASYSPPLLNLGTTYYWRVDEVNEAETPTTWQGDVWDFTAQQFIVVDGFEDYNDYPPYEIYSTWLDGYDNSANGSQVGYLTPPTIETGFVHGGAQSMPLIYSNTGGATYSETERTFAVPQDWTQYGIAALQLWFYGTAGNTGKLYVKINGVKVSYSGNAADLAVEDWQPWDIDLTTVGVNVQSVTSLTIGIDGDAAIGTLYFDDIRLY